jgi:hypothetical protein
VPQPSGFRFAHSHFRAGADLTRGTFSGQLAPVYIEARVNPGAYDREVFLVLKEFLPSLSSAGDMDADFLAGEPLRELRAISVGADARNPGWPRGYEVGYDLFSINGKMLGQGEPIRVRQGERVLLHVLNGSATEVRGLALPRDVFRVVVLDGNPAPVQANVRSSGGARCHAGRNHRNDFRHAGCCSAWLQSLDDQWSDVHDGEHDAAVQAARRGKISTAVSQRQR